MEKRIEFGTVSTTEVSASNACDLKKVYDISCTANYRNGKLATAYDGIVKKGHAQVCTFSCEEAGTTQMTMHHLDAKNSLEMNDISDAIFFFIADLRDNVPAYAKVSPKKEGGEK